MALFRLIEGSKSYPEQMIFENISIQIQKRDRIGLIGVNGAGKSTLMKILAELEYLDEGQIEKSNDLEVGYLAQDFGLAVENTLYEEMLKVFADLFALEEKIRKLERDMSTATPMELDKIMKKYSKLREEFEQEGGYQIESRIKGVLRGLGFNEDYFSSTLENFSGGEKSRAALAKLLLQEPSLLLLDEPTNHLDLESKEWLEGYLNSYPGAILIISHDRYFLDRVINRIWELEKGRLEKYKGNYSFYLQQKPQRLLTWKREYEQQQEKIEKMEAYIRKNKAGVNCKQARGRQKQLNRMELIPKPPQLNTTKIEFTSKTTSGEDVLKVEGLSKSFDQDSLFKSIDFRLYRGEKVALVGSNGAGKSTLFKILLDKITYEGQIKLGTKVKIGYFSQEHEELNSNYNLIKEMQKIKDLTVSEARDILARFLFKGEDVFKEVSMLSGGEKSRLALAKLSVRDFNFLLLDEPTNHLDIRSKERLESALNSYPGTILAISHDRYFLDKLPNKILAIEDTSLIEYCGNYSDYRKEYLNRLELKKNKEAAKKKNNRRTIVEDKKKSIDLDQVESDIMELELQIEKIEEQFNDTDICQDAVRLEELTTEYNNLKERLTDCYDMWEEAI